MTTFQAQKISPADFATVRARLVAGVGFFADGPYRYVVADSDVYRLDVVRRTADVTWSDTIKALPKLFKVVVNGGYFSGTGLYARAQFGTVAPADVDSDGDVKQGGSVVLPDDGKGKNYFFFGHDGKSPPSYDGAQGNPGASVSEGMGGLGPLILPNPKTRTPLKFGIGNRYASDPKKTATPTAADIADCVLRNNNTYAAMQAETAAGTGFCAVAVIPADKLLVMVIKPNGTPGDLDTLRDALFSVGTGVACFTDGSNSACMAVDGVMDPALAPANFKNNLIETGFGLFLYKPPPPTNITVTFVQVEVFNDASSFGAGEWTMDVDVQGKTLSLMAQREVNTGDIIAFGTGKQVAVTVPSGAELRLSVSGKDEGGIDEDLGSVSATFGPVASPAFGVGRHLQSTDYYRVTYDIALGP